MWVCVATSCVLVIFFALINVAVALRGQAHEHGQAQDRGHEFREKKYTYDDQVAGGELKKLQEEYAKYTSFSQEPPWWEHGLEMQEVDSKANADVPDHDITNYKGPTVYKYEEYKKPSDPTFLPYTDVVDNTESIAAFEDVLHLMPKEGLLVDIGGGRYDSATKWVESKTSMNMMVADPFNRPVEHNKEVQASVAKHGGADMVTSMSVLNVIPDLPSQIWHVWLVHHILKPGQLAIFKFYAGLWPIRGTRVQTVSAPLVDPTAANSQAQNNAFADAYVPVIAKVFGEANIFADSNLNTIFARKASD